MSSFDYQWRQLLRNVEFYLTINIRAMCFTNYYGALHVPAIGALRCGGHCYLVRVYCVHRDTFVGDLLDGHQSWVIHVYHTSIHFALKTSEIFAGACVYPHF